MEIRSTILWVCLCIVSMGHPLEAEKPFLKQESLLDQLSEHGLWRSGTPLQLHLGCGQSHLADYINIDFPSSEHTVQEIAGADIFGDIAQLRVSRGCVDQIRSHHVFEHFDRQTALVLLCQWASWLKPKGTIVIETPDFAASIALLQDNRLSYQEKQVIMRHIFGSHEARWAIHCDGWYKEKFEHVLQALGFGNIQFQYTRHYNLRNIIVTAQKVRNLSVEELIHNAREILRESLVDSTEGIMYSVWCSRLHAVMDTVLP